MLLTSPFALAARDSTKVFEETPETLSHEFVERHQRASAFKSLRSLSEQPSAIQISCKNGQLKAKTNKNFANIK
jgi:hypothetical protein